jgi:acetolactate synthase I/II/III large subunit
MPTTVEVLADAIKDAGTPFIVWHPGGGPVELMDAARRRDMRFVMMKQEIAGAMLAATWGGITGSPGVCLSTCRAAAINMVNEVAYSSLDRAPLIAITDQYSTPIYETDLHQRINQQAVYTPLLRSRRRPAPTRSCPLRRRSWATSTLFSPASPNGRARARQVMLRNSAPLCVL